MTGITQSQAAASAPNPRIGGGTDGDTWWTGGSNLTKRSRSKTINAHRPTAFKSAKAIENECCKALEERMHLLLEGKCNNVTLTSWVTTIRGKVEDCGMVTVFQIVDNGKETHLLEQ